MKRLLPCLLGRYMRFPKTKSLKIESERRLLRFLITRNYVSILFYFIFKVKFYHFFCLLINGNIYHMHLFKANFNLENFQVPSKESLDELELAYCCLKESLRKYSVVPTVVRSRNFT